MKDIGSRAGLSNGNTRLSSGAIGVPESRLEVTICLGKHGNQISGPQQLLNSYALCDGHVVLLHHSLRSALTAWPSGSSSSAASLPSGFVRAMLVMLHPCSQLVILQSCASCTQLASVEPLPGNALCKQSACSCSPALPAAASGSTRPGASASRQWSRMTIRPSGRCLGWCRWTLTYRLHKQQHQQLQIAAPRFSYRASAFNRHPFGER